MLKQFMSICSLFLCLTCFADIEQDNKAVIQWTQKIIRPFFNSTDHNQVKQWFSDKTWPEARQIKKTLKVTQFGAVELEQQATIDNVPAWRILVSIKAKEADKKVASKITLRLLILKTPEQSFKIIHIDKFETKNYSKKNK